MFYFKQNWLNHQRKKYNTLWTKEFHRSVPRATKEPRQWEKGAAWGVRSELTQNPKGSKAMGERCNMRCQKWTDTEPKRNQGNGRRVRHEVSEVNWHRTQKDPNIFQYFEIKFLYTVQENVGKGQKTTQRKIDNLILLKSPKLNIHNVRVNHLARRKVTFSLCVHY